VPEVGSDVLDTGRLDGLHGDRMTENVRVSIVRRDAGGRRVLLDQAARSGPWDPLEWGEVSVRRIRWYAAGNV
jgi:hypothetical protein